MKSTTTTKTPSPARAYLKHISGEFAPIAKSTGKRINDLITDYYSSLAASAEWDTFRGWKVRGFRVAKNEKGFAVWSKPMKPDTDGDTDGTDADTGTSTDGTKPAHENFYTAYIFCARQVANREGLTPDGEEYTPSGLTPPHLSAATTPTPDTKPAETPAETTTQHAPTPKQQTPQPVTVEYVEQLAFAI